MSKRKVYNYTRRTLAFLMAMIMTLSVVQSSSVTAFAQTGSTVIKTEAVDVIDETESSVPNIDGTSETVNEDDVSEPTSTEGVSETEDESSEMPEEMTVEIETAEAETVVKIIPAVDVMEDSTYTGTVTGTTLMIEESAFADSGMTFSDEAVINIINTRADNDERYDVVTIYHESITDTISQDLWNAFVSIGANTAVVCFNGGENPDERWTFYSPTSSSLGSADLSVDIVVNDDGNVVFSREYVDYSCTGGTELELYLDDLEAQSEWLAVFKAAYGEESLDYIEIRDEDNNERSSEYGAAYSYSVDACSLTINLSDTWGSTTFSLHKPHMGNEGTEEDGRSVFEINEWDMPSNGGINKTSTNEKGLAILEANSSKKYDIIQFNYRPNYEDKCTGFVSYNVWNAACSMLNESTEDSTSEIRVNFSGGSTEPDENWCIENPKLSTDETPAYLEASLTPATTAGGGAVLEIESSEVYDVTAGNASVNFYVDENGRKDLYDTFVNAYGTESMRLEFHDEDDNLVEADNLGGDYQYNTEEGDRYINISIGDVTQLTCHNKYSVVEYVYKGDYNEHEEDDGYLWQELFLHPGNLDKNSFTAEEISEILSYHDEKSFDSIVIVTLSENMNGSISADAINAALPYLKESTEERSSVLNLAFKHPTTENGIDWMLINPQTQTEDQTLSSTLSIADDTALLTLKSQSLKADSINLSIYRNKEKNADGVAAFKSVFGDASTKLSLSNSDVVGHLDYNDYEAIINIDDIGNLQANTSYQIEKYIYKGRIDKWDDGGQELVITYEDAEKDDAFTEQELVDLLANYKAYETYNEEDYLSSIYIEQPSGEKDTIYKSVADAAANLLPNGGNVKFAFRNETTATSTEWLLEGIKAGVTQTEDQNVKAALTVSSNNLIEFTRDAFELTTGDEGAVSIGYSINTECDADLSKAVFDTFGEFEGHKLIETRYGEVGGEVNYDAENNHIWLYLNGITKLNAGENYPLTSWFYRGNVNDMYDEENNIIGTSLHINLNELEEGTSFNDIIDYWLGTNRSFEHVCVEQSYSSNNVIKKDIFNAAKSLLSDPVNQEIVFTFCRCQFEEQDEEGNVTVPFVQSDMNWIFHGITKNVTKDINANVSATKKGGGVSVVLKSNTYPAEDTYVQFWMSEDAAMVQDVLVPVFGKAYPESNLVVLEKATTLKTLSNGNMPAYYDGSDGMVNLFLSNVEEWKAGIDNRLVEAYTRPEAPVGEEASVILFSYDPNDPEDPGYPPEESAWSHPDQPKSNIKFTLLTPDIATMGYRVNENGTRYDYVIPNVPWKTVYTLCTYTSVSDETCVEVLAYPSIVDISGMAFDEDAIDIEWDSDNSEHYGYLGVNINPRAAQNYFNPQEFTWTVSQSEENPVIELQKYPYYSWDEETQMDVYREDRPDGSFKVVGYGEATVTVTYGDFEPLTCTVKVLEPVRVPEIPSIFAIPTIDTTLYDLGTTTASEDSSVVHLDLDTLLKDRGANYEGSFEWKDDTISLAPYANMEWAEFAAIYTAPDGRQVPTTVAVEMLRITDIGLYAAEICENYDVSQYANALDLRDLNGSSVINGDELVMGYQVGINREQRDEEGNMTPEFLTFARYIAEGKLSINWKEQDLLTPIEKDEQAPDDLTIDANIYNNGQIQKPSKYIGTTKGKKTFTVEAVNEATQKVIFKSTATVIVTEKPVFTFDRVEIDGLYDTTMKGDFLIKVNADDYAAAKKLTIKSADTSTLKLGRITVKEAEETETGKVEITVPYEFKKYGKTVLKVTAADEVKTSESFAVERIDYGPKVLNPSITLDRAWTYKPSDEAEAIIRTMDKLNISYQYDTLPANEAITIEEPEYQNAFKLTGSSYRNSALYWIELADTTLNDKTYTLTLKIPYTIGDNSKVEYSKQKIKVKVTKSKVKVTAKQTKKINEFYKLTSEDSQGIITFNAPYTVDALNINADSVFNLVPTENPGEYSLVLKDGQDIAQLAKTQKKITLNYELSQYDSSVYSMPTYNYSGSVNVTLKAENKKPNLILPKKGDTLYPAMDVNGSGFVVMNKATGEEMDLTGIASIVLDKRKNIITPITSESDSAEAPYEYLKVGKNNYYIYTKDQAINYYLCDSPNAVKATDKFIIRIQKEHWNKPIDLTYTVKIDVKTPKLKLDSKTLTINANDEIYGYQTATTHINLTGYVGTWFDEIWISGIKDADKNALKNNLSFTWNQEESKIQISIDDKGVLNEETGIDTRLKAGNYKFKVWTMLNGKKLSTDLTLKVVDKACAKSVKVTKKGSIDVLRRGTTQITMNPKFTNLSGELVDFRLTGPDAGLFDYYYDGENGNCVVKARPGVNYSTKINYRVTPVYRLADNGDYDVEGKAQTIKVTQGKPKVSIWTNANTLYADKNAEVWFDFTATLKNENIVIRDVQLLNYTDDLCWDTENWCLSLSGNTPKDITKASDKYTLKFAVTYEDAAGNEKATQVSYKLNIVR